MKKTLIAALLSLSLLGTANANTKSCHIVIGWPPGGAADRTARLIEKYNPDYQVTYKPGGNGVIALNFTSKQPEHIYLAGADVFDSEQTELYKILTAPSNIVLTGKSSTTIENLFTGKINIGFGQHAGPQYVIARQIAKANPNGNLVSTGSDAKALLLLLSGDLDVYVANVISAGPWLDQHKELKNVLTLEYDKPFVKDKIKIESLGFTALLIHKNATETQRQNVVGCIEKALKEPGLTEELKAWNANPVMLGGKEKDILIKRYIDLKIRLDIK